MNRSPSFGTDAQLDLDIKTGVIRDALRLVDIRYKLLLAEGTGVSLIPRSHTAPGNEVKHFVVCTSVQDSYQLLHALQAV